MKRFGVVILLFSCLPASAQVDTTYVRRSDMIRGVDAVGYTLTSPVRWKGKDWLKTGGIVVGIAALTLLDEPVKDLITQKRTHFLDGLERVGYHYGKPYTAVAVTGGFYAVGVVFKNDWSRETGLMLGSALASSNLITSVFKSAVGRARPVTGLGNYEMQPFSTYASHHSLPSGHTTVAFAMSAILARRVHSLPLKITFYSLATITAASRIYTDAHWFSDVALGGTIAWLCADVAFKRLETNKWKPLSHPLNVIVKVYPYPGGLSLRAFL